MWNSPPKASQNANMKSDASLFILDGELQAPVGDGITVFWNQFISTDNPKIISITQMVDENAQELRAKYLSWVHQLGEAEVNGQRVIDHLLLRPNLSYWWMASVAQKKNLTNYLINDAIKILALEVLLEKLEIQSITLVTENSRLAECIKDFCRRTQIRFTWRKVNNSRWSYSARSLFRLAPHSFRALIYFIRFVWRVAKASNRKKPTVSSLEGEVTFFDILVHLDKRALNTGAFVSNYWTELVNKLPEWHIKSNWVHIFYKQPAIPSLNKAFEVVERFNENAGGNQVHSLLEGTFKWQLLFTALRDYWRLRRCHAKLDSIHQITPERYQFNLWPLHVDEWCNTMFGSEALVNCLFIALFEDKLARMPKQKLGVYIAENQPWELALIYAWKACGHGELIGAPHATVLFWDLRYFYDKKTYAKSKRSRLPVPNRLAVNGPFARQTLLDSGYQTEQLVDVEALRYQYLIHNLRQPKQKSESHKSLRILICGDFRESTTLARFYLLEKIVAYLPKDTEFIFKPHPAHPLNINDYCTLKITTNEELLVDLLNNSDLTLVSNSSSAAVDAYCSGVPVIQMLDAKTFNTSPLRGLHNVFYIKDEQELLSAIMNARNMTFSKYSQYFNLNGKLKRWKHLFDIFECSKN